MSCFQFPTSIRGYPLPSLRRGFCSVRRQHISPLGYRMLLRFTPFPPAGFPPPPRGSHALSFPHISPLSIFHPSPCWSRSSGRALLNVPRPSLFPSAARNSLTPGPDLYRSSVALRLLLLCPPRPDTHSVSFTFRTTGCFFSTTHHSSFHSRLLPHVATHCSMFVALPCAHPVFFAFAHRFTLGHCSPFWFARQFPAPHSPPLHSLSHSRHTSGCFAGIFTSFHSSF